ncbi:PREDICTED: tubby-like protein 8 [Erythranthe guttata]|nr:PREDICTED: tubby-like protein 8 [Erythranthe guttata]|eukprot:XP_012856843.1 PREDICTED: tubby-like protein 8 [Erythranthe guttata]
MLSINGTKKKHKSFFLVQLKQNYFSLPLHKPITKPMAGGCKKTATISRQSSCTSTHRNPLIQQNHHHHHRTSSDGGGGNGVSLGSPIRRCDNNNKENIAAAPNAKPGKFHYDDDKENTNPNDDGKNLILKDFSDWKSQMKENLLKPSSLQVCIKKNEPDSVIGLKKWESLDSEKPNAAADVWDYSDSEAAPVSSWSTLPNRALLCRPLPLDVGRCTCIIVKESSPDGFDGGTLYTLYTNEGKGRQNRKLAVAHHRRRRGRSEFTVAQNTKGIASHSDDSLIGTVTSNIIGSKYHIWDQGHCLKSSSKKNPKLLASVNFTATVSTWTGNYRSMKAWIPKHQSMQLKNTNQIQHINGLPTEWEANKDKVHQLFSKIPSYNKFTKRYELDFRDRGRAGLKIQSSVKNFQLTLERNGKQTILQLGRLGKSKYVMDYRYPLTGYQAFCMCLASIDSKLCCSV